MFSRRARRTRARILTVIRGYAAPEGRGLSRLMVPEQDSLRLGPHCEEDSRRRSAPATGS